MITQSHVEDRKNNCKENEQNIEKLKEKILGLEQQLQFTEKKINDVTELIKVRRAKMKRNSTTRLLDQH